MLFAAASAAGVVPEHIRGGAIAASKVCVDNSAGFVLNFWFDDLVTGDKSAPTENYPIDQYKCLSIGDALPETQTGDLIMTYVKAVLGTTRSVDTAITYDATAPTATFTCTGTTLDYSCRLNGEEMDAAKEYANFFKMIFHDFDQPERRMPDAPGEFLAGYIYGISLQQYDIRNSLMQCINIDEDLTNDMYDAFAAFEKEDYKTGNKKMKDAIDRFGDAVDGCGADVNDPIQKYYTDVANMHMRDDWEDFSKKIYDANKKQIDSNISDEFKWWDAGVFFNSGMFAGRTDKIFLDAE